MAHGAVDPGVPGSGQRRPLASGHCGGPTAGGAAGRRRAGCPRSRLMVRRAACLPRRSGLPQPVGARHRRGELRQRGRSGRRPASRGLRSPARRRPGFGRPRTGAEAGRRARRVLLLPPRRRPLDPATVRQLGVEAFRSNAGVVGPKLVEWNDPLDPLRGIRHRQGGVLVPLCGPGKLEHKQHGTVRDVFMVPSGCILVHLEPVQHA